MRFTSGSCNTAKTMRCTKFAPVCRTYCASDSFWFLKTANILQCTVCFLQSAMNTTAQFADMIPYLATVMQFADVSFALHCCKYYPMAELRAMNWCCIMPCNVQVLAAECCKYRAILRQILRSLEILTANDQHMVHGYFHTEVLSQRHVFTQTFAHTHAFTERWFYTGVFRQGCFYTKKYTQTRGYFYTQMPSHSGAVTECLYTHELLHRASFDTKIAK